MGTDVIKILIPTVVPSSLAWCLSHIVENATEYLEVYVFDNQETNEVDSICHNYTDDLVNVVVLHPRIKGNAGINHAYNTLAAVASGEKQISGWLMFFEDDIHLPTGWQSKLHMDRMQKDIIYSGVEFRPSKTKDGCYSPDGFSNTHINYIPTSRSVNEMDNIIEQNIQNGIPSIWGDDYPILVHTTLWKTIGLLDEAFYPGYYGSDDFLYTMYKKKLTRVVTTRNFLFVHLKHGTTRACMTSGLVSADKHREKRYFMEKHGKNPNQAGVDVRKYFVTPTGEEI